MKRYQKEIKRVNFVLKSAMFICVISLIIQIFVFFR
jgi:hypothetical protein